MEKLKKLFTLFITTFSISMTANSGFAVLAGMKAQLVKKKGWYTEDEMNTFATLAQSSPGPIAINASVIIGYQVAGFWGSFAAALGCAMPPLIIMLLVSVFYNAIVENAVIRTFMTGVQFGVAAMLLDVVWGMFKSIMKQNKLFYYLLAAFCLAFVCLTDFSVFYLFLICVAAALIRAFCCRKEGKA